MVKVCRVLFLVAFVAGMIVMSNGEISTDEYFFTWAALESCIFMIIYQVKQDIQKEERDD